MNIDDFLHVQQLFDIYQGLLTSKQRQVMDDYYNADLSLGEIAENQQVSRQAVHDMIRKSNTHLHQLEEQLHIITNKQKQRNQVKHIKTQLQILNELFDRNEHVLVKDQMNYILRLVKEMSDDI